MRLTIRAGFVGLAAVALPALVTSGVVGGVRALFSSLGGLLLVGLFFLATLVFVEVANAVGPSMTLPAGLLGYGTLVLVCGMLLFATPLPDHLHLGAFVWTVVAATLAWLVAQCVGVWRAQIPYVQPTRTRRRVGDVASPTGKPS